MAGLVTLSEALAIVLGEAAPLPGETVSPTAAVGRRLSSAVTAVVDAPPFASSAMDGFAVRSQDAPGRLTIVGHAAAGRPSERILGMGEAIEISTGAVVPGGADAVVPVELVRQEATEVVVDDAIEPGRNIRPAGGDVQAGETALRAGTRIGPAQLAALITAGATSADVHRRASVTVVSTGTELREPGSDLRPGEIYESNSRMLEAVFRSHGADVRRLGPVADDASSHREILADALASDVVVTSGGVSVGPHDLVRETLAGLGVSERFWGIAVRPGKPVSFGVHAGGLVFGLPGNPVSALVGAVCLVAPALRALHGDPRPETPALRGVLSAGVRRNPSRDDLVRAVTRTRGADVYLDVIEGQDSHMIVRAAAADALVHVTRGEGTLPEGSVVTYYLLDRPGP